VYVGTHGVDYAARIGAERPGRRDRDARQPAHDEEIEMIEGRGVYANANVRRCTQLGNCEIVAKLEAFESAVAGDSESAHLTGLYFVTVS
jgi:hypothetical protein